MEFQAAVNIFQDIGHHIFEFYNQFIVRLHRIHMDYKKEAEPPQRLPFNAVNDLMAELHVTVIGDLCMDGGHASGWPIIMYNQIMGSHNTVKALHKITDFLIKLRVNPLSYQGRQGIFCNIHAGNHDHHGHDDSHNAIHIQTGHAINSNGENRGRRSCHIPHCICRSCHHDLGINPFSKLLVKHGQPQLHPHGEQEDDNGNPSEGHILGMDDLAHR